MFGLQEQPTLSTIEIYVNRTKVLRNNMHAILEAEDAWRHYNKKRKPLRLQRAGEVAEFAGRAVENLTFHTPQHCMVTHEDGEFVFMGRRRFEEMMVICAPRLDEWARIVYRFAGTDNAPCMLSS